MSVACIIGIVGPRNFGAASPRDNSTRIDRRRIASKGLVRLVTNGASVKFDKDHNYEVEMGFGVTKKAVFRRKMDFLLWTAVVSIKSA
jgi:hypothetical protein